MVQWFEYSVDWVNYSLFLHTDSLFTIHPNVKEALEGHRPVVALESTIITHGMPYPLNLR